MEKCFSQGSQILQNVPLNILSINAPRPLDINDNAEKLALQTTFMMNLYAISVR